MGHSPSTSQNRSSASSRYQAVFFRLCPQQRAWGRHANSEGAQSLCNPAQARGVAGLRRIRSQLYTEAVDRSAASGAPAPAMPKIGKNVPKPFDETRPSFRTRERLCHGCVGRLCSVRSLSPANSQLTVNGTKLTFSQMAGAALSFGNAVETRRPRSNLAAALRQRPVLLISADSTRPINTIHYPEMAAGKQPSDHLRGEPNVALGCCACPKALPALGSRPTHSTGPPRAPPS